MYLCCVESLNWFRSKLDFLRIFKVAPKLGQSPCTIVQCTRPNFAKNEKERILHFYNFIWCIYMYLCCVESLNWFRSKWDFLRIFKVAPKSGQSPCTIVQGTRLNFAKNEKERILHFYNFIWCIYMYLCCVESLNWFRSKLDFLRIFKVAPKSGQSPCTIVQGTRPNFAKNEKERILYFYNFIWCIYMYLCCVESLNWFRSKLDFLRIFKVAPKSGQSPCTIVQGFWPNFAKNEKERILHFYNFIWCIYMYLCCVESLNWFRSKLDFLRIFKVAPKSGQSPCTIVQGTRPNFAKNEKERILHFYNFIWCIYMYLCCVESLNWFRSKLDFLRIFKVAPKLGKSPCTIVQGTRPNFAKNEKERILHFYNFIWCIYMYLCCVESLNWFRSKLDFLRIFKVAPKLGQSPCTIVQCTRPNFAKNEKERILHFYNFIWCIYMYLCCVESLNWFRSKWDFLRIFKVAPKSGQSPCTIVQGTRLNFAKNEKERILHFYNFIWCIYMYLCCVESLNWFRSKLDFLRIFKVAPKSGQVPRPNFAKNEKERILHFYNFIWCIYMYLCCVESLNWFRSKWDFLRIFKVSPKSGQSPCTIVQGTRLHFAKNEKERILHFYNFIWCIYMYLCCVESLNWFRSKLDFLRIFKVAPKSGQSPCTIVQGTRPNFAKNEKERILYFYNFIWCIYMYFCCVESLNWFQSKLDDSDQN